MKELTILIFMAADNNLGSDGFATRDLHEMERVGSSAELNVVVQVDQYGDGDKGVALRGQIIKNTEWEKFKIQYISPLENIGETNTGDPMVLQEFLEWGTLTFPSKKTALVIWNHGSGWKPDFIYEQAALKAGPDIAKAMRAASFADKFINRTKRVLFKNTVKSLVNNFIDNSLYPIISKSLIENINNLASTSTQDNSDNDSADDILTILVNRAIGLDETSNHDALDCIELKTALEKARINISRSTQQPFVFNIIGFDACLMAGIEVAYQIRESCEYIVASEEIEPGVGWRYDLILEDFNSTYASSELARLFVDKYITGLENYKIRLVTQSAIATKELPKLVELVNKLGEFLLSILPAEYASMAKGEKMATRFYDSDFLDLGDFCSKLITSQPLVVDTLQQAISETILYSLYKFPVGNQAPTGLSIYFPTKPKFDTSYETLDFSRDNLYWKKAICAYHFIE